MFQTVYGLTNFENMLNIFEVKTYLTICITSHKKTSFSIDFLC